MSYLPFSGGKRVCFGKTFAEMALKVICSMMAHKFNFSFADSDDYCKFSKGRLPMIMIGQSHYPKLPVKLSKRND